MSALPTLTIELREMQPLYALIADRPELVQLLEREHGLERVEVNDTRTLSPEQLVGMNEALHHHGVQRVSAELAARVDQGAGEGLAYFARSCAHLRELLGQLLRWEPIWLPGARLDVREGSELVVIEMRPRAQDARLGLLVYWEGTWTWLCRLLRACLGIDAPLSDIRLMTPHCAHPERLTELFGAPVQAASDGYRLCLPRAWLDRPFPGANPDLRLALSICFDLLSRRGADRNLRLQVLQCFDQARSAEDFTLPRVAEQLKAAPATLRRQLKADGVTFSSLLQGYRRSKVLQEAVEEGAPVGKVALGLGLSGGAALERAARDWWGVGPMRLREGLVRLHGLNAGPDWASPLGLPCYPGMARASAAEPDGATEPLSGWSDPVAYAFCLGRRTLAGFSAQLPLDVNGLLVHPDEAEDLLHLRRARQLVSAPKPLPPELRRRWQCLMQFVQVNRADLSADLCLLISWLDLGAMLLEQLVGADYDAMLAETATLPWQEALVCERQRYGLCRLAAARLLLARWGVAGHLLSMFRLLEEGVTAPQGADMDAHSLALLGLAMASCER